MLQLRTIMDAADNTGAKQLELIGIPGHGNKLVAHLGDIVKCVVKKAIPTGMVKEHEKVFVVIVRTRRSIRRNDGSIIRFDDNAGVILENVEEKLPKGTRIFGPIAREIKDLGFNKIASMAQEVY
ncbi:50S ribosomal protein L14 [Candidatus Roizmanbacteria bacterium]|nr:50S ribosomal protein L14 [Candidatus Roizmanbacteria bacterium]